MTKTLYVNEFLFLPVIKGKALPNHPQPVKTLHKNMPLC